MYIGTKTKMPKYQLGDLEVGDKFSANDFDFKVVKVLNKRYVCEVINDLDVKQTGQNIVDNLEAIDQRR